MGASDWLWTGTAAFAVFFVADFVYVLDHYLVHYDRDRYKQTHSRHHRRYNGMRDGPHFDAFERATYNSAGFGLLLCMSVLSLFTGNLGFVLGAALKWVHSFAFHLYQHRWWCRTPVAKLELGRPPATWGLATARYHAYHHSHPNASRFTFAESWAGFDRILERVHPWLVRFTADARRRRRKTRAASADAGAGTGRA